MEWDEEVRGMGSWELRKWRFGMMLCCRDCCLATEASMDRVCGRESWWCLMRCGCLCPGAVRRAVYR